MNKSFIKLCNKTIREKRPFLCMDKACEVFQSGDLLEIGFLSKQCKNDLNGSCLICDYGKAHCTWSIQTYISEMDTIIASYNNKKINYLLLCCNGSIMDESQISTELLSAIFKRAQNSGIPNIIIETHYRDVTIDKLNLIKQIIQKPVIIEMGLETVNQKFQDIFFMKGIKMDKYEKTISKIQEYGYDVEINVLLGLPFLSEKEQIADTIQSIKWVIKHNCTPIIFPVNIKPYTMLKYAYNKNLYQPISLWSLIYLLDSLTPHELSNVLIAWYGNREDGYQNDIPVIFPQSCDKCRYELLKFGRDFLDSNQYSDRKRLINNLIASSTCNCYENVCKNIKHSIDLFDDKYNRLLQNLHNDFYDLKGNK